MGLTRQRPSSAFDHPDLHGVRFEELARQLALGRVAGVAVDDGGEEIAVVGNGDGLGVAQRPVVPLVAVDARAAEGVGDADAFAGTDRHESRVEKADVDRPLQRLVGRDAVGAVAFWPGFRWPSFSQT